MLLDTNPHNRRYKLPGPMPKVSSITIHNTANKGPARAERDYLNRRKDPVSISFHFAVDEKEIIQIMPLDIHAWHAGDGRGKGNMESIAIEICRSTHPNPALYLQAEANAVKLAAHLLLKFHLETNALRMHRDWSGKHCPHRILDAGTWEDFKKRVQRELQQLRKR